jgi:hypothetical protein
MANTFSIATLNLGGNQVPLPGSATQFSGGVSPPTPLPETSFSMNPIAPLPTGPGTNSTAI